MRMRAMATKLLTLVIQAGGENQPENDIVLLAWLHFTRFTLCHNIGEVLLSSSKLGIVLGSTNFALVLELHLLSP